jgi:ribosomal protein S18 acetylase RimI-like enzyme
MRQTINAAEVLAPSVAIVSPPFTTRRWQPVDEPFLWEMLFLSIHVRDGHEPLPRSILHDHDIAHYLTEFGRARDDAQLAFDDAGQPIGAAWCRAMPSDDPGYGFVADDIPELGTAVVAEWRGRGVGTLLIEQLVARHPIISLSVDNDNEGAKALYQRLGFESVGIEGTATTMLRRPSAP